MKFIHYWFTALVFTTGLHIARAENFADRCVNRTALERVYHAHRIETKQPFEQLMPHAMIEKLVHLDQRKESTLRKVYGVEITSEMLAAEVQRINTTTRAPEMLAEIKTALGNDAARFASAIARPIIVERELRSHFENDDKLHAEQRREAEKARDTLLAEKPIEGMTVVTWQLAARLEQDKPFSPATPMQGKTSSNAYTNDATAQLSQVIPTPNLATEGKEKIYFDDIDPQLQKVLRVQLQKPSDVSAVIEMPSGFLVFLAKEKTAETLTVASLTIPKRSYEEWLAQQPE